MDDLAVSRMRHQVKAILTSCKMMRCDVQFLTYFISTNGSPALGTFKLRVGLPRCMLSSSFSRDRRLPVLSLIHHSYLEAAGTMARRTHGAQVGPLGPQRPGLRSQCGQSSGGLSGTYVLPQQKPPCPLQRSLETCRRQ